VFVRTFKKIEIDVKTVSKLKTVYLQCNQDVALCNYTTKLRAHHPHQAHLDKVVSNKTKLFW
jgi:hypothetical protein